MSSFPSIRIEGGLLGPDLLDQLVAGELPGQKPADFGLDARRNLTDEIAAVFADARALWGVFQNRLGRLAPDDLATTVTRDAWVLPFLGLLGYEVRFNQKAYELDGMTFAVSHRAGEADDAPPIHIVGARQELGRLAPSGRPRLAPHSLVQEYLNRTEQVWGLVTNGTTLRVLRDSTLIRRQAYLEFDLAGIFEEQRFLDFAALYRLLFRTRLPKGLADTGDCLLEKYYVHSVEQGGRVRDHLRDGVETCIGLLANGFLSHPKNAELQRAVLEKQLSDQTFYRELLRLIYRFLFLLVSEDRGLVSPNPIYREHYGVARLRRMLDRRSAFTDHDDLWHGLRLLWQVFGREDWARMLELAPLNGELFAAQTLDACCISNKDLLSAFWYLAYYQESHGSPARRVNYAALNVEELGSVYESLLDFHPALDRDAAGRPTFRLIYGSERKTTGSYYTPRELVAELVESALVPVMRQRLDEAAKLDKRAGGTKCQQAALLSLKIIDVACGSGHMLLAAARRVGKELARLRSGEEEPSPERAREAVRDVIGHCTYGVDKNPLAVDLCRVALWLESHTSGKPLTFLDHRIRCGDSLVGVFDLACLGQGIPDKAFEPMEGDNKAIARAAGRRNRDERSGARNLFMGRIEPEIRTFSQSSHEVDAIPDDSPPHIRQKKELYESSHREPGWLRQKQACDLWTAAFFQCFTSDSTAITSAALFEYMAGRQIDARLLAEATVLAGRHRFFHWPLEFPETFSKRGNQTASDKGDGQTGFDVILSNPPWERIKLQEQEFFAARDEAIATAPNKAARGRLIDTLAENHPTLHAEFTTAVHDADCLSKFLRQGGRFPLTATGDINTYAVFAETIHYLVGLTGRAGIILPTGIVTDDTTKRFFSNLVGHGQLAAVLGFENEEFLFPAVHHAFKFCTVSVTGEKVTVRETRLAFFVRNFVQLRDTRRQFSLAPDDFAVLNPNTLTCPIFRTKADAELTRKIYQNIPVLVREGQSSGNQWGISFMRMLDMSNDSGLFHDSLSEAQLPLYEAKMMWQFDHRFTTYEGATEQQINVGILPSVTPEQKADPAYRVRSRYWVDESEVLNRLAPQTKEEQDALADGKLQSDELIQRQRKRAPQWLLGFRDITNTTNERTAIFSLLPRVGVGHKAPLIMFPLGFSLELQLCLTANFNSMVLDFVVRQKLGGMSLTYFILKQLPVLPPAYYKPVDILYVASRVLELVYTSDDLTPLAEAIRASESSLAAVVPRVPYRWDEARRAVLRAELDAWFARAYGLTRDELRYILDPTDVYGPDFPSETFRVLREKEQKVFGEYRTRRLVLEAWDRLPQAAMSANNKISD